MKMPRPLFDELAADMRAVAAHYAMDLHLFTPMQDLWRLFHKIMRDRQYDDTHPGFAQGLWVRVLPCSDRFWLDRFYKDADLNDDHIATALRKIAREANKETTNG